MAFLKLDTDILTSTLWIDREAREVFLTALLMAEPFEVLEPMPQLRVRTLEPTGFEVPPGWYGLIRAAGVGIIRMAMVEQEPGMCALERLGEPDPESRNRRFDGRRLVRVNGGYIALNFMEFRDRDHTAATRSKRYRERLKAKEAATRSDGDATRGDALRDRSVTQAEAEAYSEAKAVRPRKNLSKERSSASNGDATKKRTWLTPVSEVWNRRFGPDTFPFKQHAKALATLYNRGEPPAEVARRLENYLAVTDAQYLSVPKFVQTYGDWLEAKNGNGHARPSKQEIGRKNLADAVERRARERDSLEAVTNGE